MARSWPKHPKEPELARHQSGRNSGVVHAGLYHPAGSLKATLCRQGRAVLNELAVEAGRDPKSLTVLAYIAPAERAVLGALAEAGADAAVVRLEGESEAAALAQLEQLAQQVL